ncbi:MAG: OpgC domain-containing protein [Rubellimicrobium sp.]|nr:OpgC domain-containing protein [Rubellimicrobium sp.]
MAEVPGPASRAAPGATISRARDPRLDVFRGLALAMIFVNHVPGNPLEAWTSRNFGFSDAAEGFVYMAGVSAGLAYGAAFALAGDMPGGVRRVFGRVWGLYLVHLAMTVMALGIAAGAALWFATPGMLRLHGVDLLFRDPLGALSGLPILTWQLGYFDILPLYVVLLAAAPVALAAAWRAPLLLGAGSVLLWLLAAETRMNLPVVGGSGWFFNPLSWQILFVFGILTGVAMRDGRRLVPVRGWAVALAGGFLALALLWRLWPELGAWGGHQLWRLQQTGAPRWITSFDKNYLHLPRLVHFLALAYLLSALPAVMRACASRAARPLAVMGSQALPVFATGSVLAWTFQTVKTRTGSQPMLDLAMVLSGLGLLWVLAAVRARARA